MDQQHVLVVEDDGLQSFVIARILERAGYDAIGPCLTLSQAISALKLRTIDAAVLDIGPGTEFAAPLADHLTDRGIPFIFLAAHARRGLPERHRMRPYLVPPWSDQTLFAALDGMLRTADHDRIAS